MVGNDAVGMVDHLGLRPPGPDPNHPNDHSPTIHQRNERRNNVRESEARERESRRIKPDPKGKDYDDPHDNCYTRACNKPNREGKRDDVPGSGGGDPWDPAGAAQVADPCAYLLAKVKLDFLVKDADDIKCCPEGWQKIRLYVYTAGGQRPDYHFLGRTPDGTWVSKNGANNSKEGGTDSVILPNIGMEELDRMVLDKYK